MVDLVSGNITHVFFDPNRLTEPADSGNGNERQNAVLDQSQDRGKKGQRNSKKCMLELF